MSEPNQTPNSTAIKPLAETASAGDAPITFADWLQTSAGKLYKRLSYVSFSIVAASKLLEPFGPTSEIIKHIQPGLIGLFVQIIYIGYIAYEGTSRYKHLENTDEATFYESLLWEKLELQDSSSHSGVGEISKDKKQDLWLKFKCRVNKVVEQFVIIWTIAWITWLLHYCLLFYTMGAAPPNAVPPNAASSNAVSSNAVPPNAASSNAVSHDVKAVALRNLLNNCNSLAFIFLFMTLTVSTSKYRAMFWLRIASSILAVYLLEVSLVNMQEKQLARNAISLLFTILSGLFACTALASFVGSINSKFINVPIYSVSILYLYSAIQPLYFVFDAPSLLDAQYREIAKQSGILLSILAFGFKIVLFMTVTWILTTGRLVYFMIEEGSLNFQKDKNFAEFIRLVKITDTQIH